jgi:hypothetical protein
VCAVPASSSRFSSALRCEDYFVHAPVTQLAAGLWIAERAAPPARRKLQPGRSRRGAHHILGSYTRLTAAKDAILSMVADDGQDVGEHGKWHVHHVVEGDIYADVHFEELEYDWMYKYVLPCVLVDDLEHARYFHSVSRGAQSTEMHGVKAKGAARPEQRAAAARAEFLRVKRSRDSAGLAQLRNLVVQRETLFSNLHEYDPALLAVSDAVFRRIRARLDEPAR